MHRFTHRAARVLVAGFLASCASSHLLAVTHPDIEKDPNAFLFGDLGGARVRLAAKGITFDVGYTSEAAHNVTGGSDRLTRYTDQWNLGGKIDLDKLVGWHGAVFRLMITDRNGRDLDQDAHLGTSQQVQELYGRGQTWRLTKLSLQQQFFNGRLSIKGGRLGIGSDFAAFGCDFQNLSFCGAPPGNIVGDYWYNWPVSVWALLVTARSTAHTYLQLGGYQINPRYIDDRYARSKGWLPTFPRGTTGALIPLEFGWKPSLRGLLGSYRIGGWYNNAKTDDLSLDINHQPIGLTGAPALLHAGAYGGYVNLQQQISGSADGAGTSVFFNLTQADARTAATDRQIALGATYAGPFGRPDDLIGVAIGATHANGRYADYQRAYNSAHRDDHMRIKDGNEYTSEMFYSWSPIAALSLRPNLQYVLHPGGSGENHSVWVVGMRTTVAF